MKSVLPPLLFCVTAAGMNAQPVTIVPDRPTCASCKIRMTLRATLGHANDSILLSSGSFAVRDSRGMHYAEGVERGVILQYDSVGTFVKPISRRGEGPGEFRVVSAMAIGPGDSLHVFGGRYAVFSPSGAFVRTSTPFSTHYQVHSAVVLESGATIAQFVIPSADRAGKLFHMIGTPGDALRSFGESPDRLYVESFASARRRIAPASPTSFWAAELSRYRIERWESGGRLVQVFERRAECFPPWDPALPLANPTVARRPPMVRTLAVDRVGRLWVSTTVADKNWTPQQGSRLGPNWTARAFDTIVEVIDPRLGRVVHAERFPNAFDALLGAGLISELIEDSAGMFSLLIWQLELVTTGKEER